MAACSCSLKNDLLPYLHTARQLMATPPDNDPDVHSPLSQTQKNSEELSGVSR